jgi:hypothetical protein
VPASSAGGGTDELASPLLLLVLPPAVWGDSPVPATLRSTASYDCIIPPPCPTIYHLKLKGANQSEHVLEIN